MTAPAEIRMATPVVTVVDPTPPLFPRLPSWRTLLGLLLTGLVVTAVCGQIAYWLATLEDEVWEARSEIEYRGEAWVETAAAELGSRSRVEAIASANDIPIKDFEEHLTAGAVPGTQLLEYRFTDPDPALALAVVDQLTESYLTDPENSLDETVVRVQEEIDELGGELDRARAELQAVAAAPGDPASAAERVAESEVNRLLDLLTAAEDRLLQAELDLIAAADRAPEVVTAPYVAEEPVAPRPLRRAAFGILVGLVLSAVVAALVLSRDPVG